MWKSLTEVGNTFSQMAQDAIEKGEQLLEEGSSGGGGRGRKGGKGVTSGAASRTGSAARRATLAAVHEDGTMNHSPLRPRGDDDEAWQEVELRAMVSSLFTSVGTIGHGKERSENTAASGTIVKP